MGEWIDVKDQLPPQLQPVLINEVDLGVMVAHRLVDTFKGWDTNGFGGLMCVATHWQPLPERPAIPAPAPATKAKRVKP